MARAGPLATRCQALRQGTLRLEPDGKAFGSRQHRLSADMNTSCRRAKHFAVWTSERLAYVVNCETDLLFSRCLCAQKKSSFRRCHLCIVSMLCFLHHAFGRSELQFL